MKRMKKWTLGIIGSAVLFVLGISSCSKKALNNNEIVDVYGPPPAPEYVDSLDNPETEITEPLDTIDTKEKK